jgi:cupin 2 domain-containing protein
MNPLPEITNLYECSPADQEQFFALLQTDSAKLEHIVSNGQASEADFWYDQAQPEWVALIQGEATLEFEGGTTLKLIAGDSLTIPALCKHRVACASQDAVWLALHYNSQKS